MTTVRGITSGVRFIWSSGGTHLKEEVKTGKDFTTQNLDIYFNTYIIPQLNVSDDGRTYQCKAVINTNPTIVEYGNVTLKLTGIVYNLYASVPMLFSFTVPTPTVSITPSGPIQGAMVGSPQDIQCTVSTVSGVELSSVMISWMGPGGNTIRNDSRVTISPTSGSGNNYTSSLQLMYLMEGDEGTYECSVMILETKESFDVEMNSFAGEYLCNQLYTCSRDLLKHINTLLQNARKELKNYISEVMFCT